MIDRRASRQRSSKQPARTGNEEPHLAPPGGRGAAGLAQTHPEKRSRSFSMSSFLIPLGEFCGSSAASEAVSLACMAACAPPIILPRGTPLPSWPAQQACSHGRVSPCLELSWVSGGVRGVRVRT